MNEYVEVKAVNHIDSNGSHYEYKHSFERVHVDEVDDVEVVSMRGAEIEREEVEELGTVVVYRYDGEDPVFLTEEKVFARSDSNIRDAENQAYHALSVLDSKGFVSKFD